MPMQLFVKLLKVENCCNDKQRLLLLKRSKCVPFGRSHSWERCFVPAHTCHKNSASTPEQQYCTPPSEAPVEQTRTHTAARSHLLVSLSLLAWMQHVQVDPNRPWWSGTGADRRWTEIPWVLWTDTLAEGCGGSSGTGCCCSVETWQCRFGPGNKGTAGPGPERQRTLRLPQMWHLAGGPTRELGLYLPEE